MRRIIAAMGAVLAAVLLLAGCGSPASDATVASRNLSTAADQFEITRRIVFLNGITDKYIMEITGRCSITDQGGQLEVTCKTGPTNYKKHFLGLSDNVSYFAEQLESADVNVYQYRVIFKPETIIPDVEIKTSGTAPR